MKISCIIVEDEPLAQERLRSYIAKLPYLQLAQSFDNGIDALIYLKSNPADLIFLDINMPDLSGIQLLEHAQISCQVILTTAYDAYALKGFELKVTDYLLKPFTFERFLQAVTHAQQNLEKKEIVADKKFLFVKTEYRLEKILLGEVLYIEGMRDYRRIHTQAKKIMTLQTFYELEEKIPSSVICRVHKSYMVALDKIDAIERDRIQIQGILIPVSGTYKKQFMELINRATQ